MSVLRVTTFSGLGVGDWSFYPGSAQKLVSKPMGLVIAELVGDPPQSVVSQKQPDAPFVGASNPMGRSRPVTKSAAWCVSGWTARRRVFNPPSRIPDRE